MKIFVNLELPENLYEQLKQALSEQPHLDSIEELAISCLEDAMEERAELLAEMESQATNATA